MPLPARLKTLYFALPSRRARPASVARNLVKTLVQSAGMWLAFLIVGPFILWRVEDFLLTRDWPISRFAPQPILAVALFICGWIVAWWSAWSLVRWGDGTPLPIDATNKLVVRGPYQWVRNPMACGSLLQCVAIGVWFGSPLVIIYAVGGGVLWHIAVRPWEEADLRARFGADFDKYRRNVRCWWPRFASYRA